MLVSLRKRPGNSVGTYGMIGVLAHPSRLLRQPSPAESQTDIAAMRRGETRRVACFLMGSFAPLPPRLRQGWLYLSSRDAQWKPLWSIRRRARQLNGPVESVKARLADEREPLMIQGGKYGGIVARPKFGVVTCRTASGWFYLAVPAPDVPLVVDHFSPQSRPAA